MRGFFSCSAVLVLVACGGATVVPDAGPDASVSDATIVDASDDVALDAVVEADVETPLGDAGLFLCVDCYCDGRTSYCRGLSGPHAPIDDAGDAGNGVLDAGLCAPATTVAGCVPYPPPCAPSPTCACLLANQVMPGCGCALVDGGAGYDVSCYVP
jgi:hypothetical protein